MTAQRFVVHGKWGRAAAEAFDLEADDLAELDIPRDRKRKTKRKAANSGSEREGTGRNPAAPGRD